MPILEKVKWGADRERAFALWFYDELHNNRANRSALETKWEEAIVQWRAMLPKGTKEFPWIGASNLVFPLTAIHSDPVYADFLQTLHASKDYWTVEAKRSDRVEYANPLTEFMTSLERSFLKMRQVNQRAFLDNNILGTAIYKCHWLSERKMVRDYDEFGKVAKMMKAKSQPLIEHVPLQHFYIPADAWNINPDAPVGGARWVAQEIWLTPAELKLRASREGADLPNYDKKAVEKVMSFEMTRENRVDDKIRDLDDYKPWREQRIRLYEVWARFDVDGDGIEEDIQVIWHHDTFTPLRTLHSPFLHGERPFHATRYLPGFGFYGIGLAEADEWAQLTTTKLLNATIDNVMIANSQMFSAPKSYMGDMDVYPGKVWYVGPGEEVKAIPMGSVKGDIFNIQAQMMQWSEMRTGVSELRQGNISNLPSRTPAATAQSVMQESNKRFDMILSNIRDIHGEMGRQTLQNVAQFYRDDPERWGRYCEVTLGVEDAAKVKEVLMTEGVHDVGTAFGVSVTATSAQVNKNAEQQNLISVMQITSQIFGALNQMSMLMMQVPPETPAYATAAAGFGAGVQMLERILETFDIQNPSAYMGSLRDLAASLTGQAQQAQQMGAMAGMAMDPAMMGALGPQGLGPMGMQPGLPPFYG